MANEIEKRGNYWKDKAKSYAPSWFFSQPNAISVNAFFDGLGEVFAEFEKNMLENIGETFVDCSSGEFLDQHAKERGFERIMGEDDDTLRARIKTIVSATDCAQIEGSANAALGINTNEGSEDEKVRVYENNELGFFAGDFSGDQNILTEVDEFNHFSIVIPEDRALTPTLVEIIQEQKALGISSFIYKRGT